MKQRLFPMKPQPGVDNVVVQLRRVPSGQVVWMGFISGGQTFALDLLLSDGRFQWYVRKPHRKRWFKYGPTFMLRAER